MSESPNITVGPLGRPKLSRDGRSMVVSIPIQMRRQGGRKSVITPPDTSPWVSPPRVDETIVKAIVRAHRWRNMLESKLFSSVRELAKAEKINESYLCRMLRLTLLSPALTEAILDGRQPDDVNLGRILKGLPALWDQQKASLQD
ncbi:hypothetical protein J2W51_000134 [Tardiphaga robiniae]|uniref:hypothetical protein n=1 Tax=Tardiphaga robiniae TaxID=943830 RepID=UPI0028604B26|nr:hypothetical protein [Tardiphaga robiniae]MDR6657592.1 hypothetical protein [Tardiphaga robiniae]